MKQPIYIVGSGIIGLLSARELAQAGLAVVVLDRQAIGREASWAGGGILSPLYSWRYPEAINRLARWSQAAYPGLTRVLAQETGVDAEWSRSGLLILDAKDAELGAKWAEKWAISLKRVDPEELRQLQPGLTFTGSSALWMPDVAQVRNPRLLAALRSDLLRSGVELRENVPVTGFSAKGGRLQSLETPDDNIPADRCLVAAGAWTGRLLAGTGLKLAIEPVRGQILLLQARLGQISRIVLKGEHYVIPRRDGHVLVGSTQEHVGFDKSTTEAARRDLHATALALFPDLADAEILQQWASLRPQSPTGIPIIGEHPEIQGLYVCAGHFRNGLALGPASTRLMADLILERKPVIDPQPYRLQEAA